ncbi:MAG: Fic family protein [Candidatus Latescibacteria bacterium]|nr:Fic family protein [Candidatus Latescibacterota bacterium]
MKADQRRTARFVALLQQAGRQDCFTAQALMQLQRVIVDERYAASGFRDFQNYVGQSLGPARELIHYVPPKPEDLPALMEGWMTTCRALQAGGVHPVVTAAVAGFGLVFLHPFEDGNGRLHRFLLHHALAAGQFSPAGVIFPVSATMLRQRPRYDAALEVCSREVSLLVEYELDDQGVMRVRGETARFYRYPDLTAQAEALFGFIQDTLRTEMVAELEYLEVFDTARQGLRAVVDMPDRRLELLLRLCMQGKGRLSKAKREQFPELTDAECRQMETIVQAAIVELNPDAAAVDAGGGEMTL